MAVWQVRDGKACFSELLEAALKKGPQVITRRGIEVAVLVAIDEWHRLRRTSRPGLKALLLAAPGPRFENLIPDRRKLRRRKLVKFS